MTDDALCQRLVLIPRGDGEYRVTARESTNLEFKRDMALSTFRKSLKTIAAFSNKTGGGQIVFGISDNPRQLVGVDVGKVLDEGQQSEEIKQAIAPMPTTHFATVTIHYRTLGILRVEALPKPPALAIRDIPSDQGKHVLRAGTVYVRRRGQTAPITGVEFSQLLNSRDEQIRRAIFTYLGRGRDIGFDRVVVADPERSTENDAKQMTFYLPATAAAGMNVLDKATLVQEDGAPAYKLVGNVKLSMPTDQDPREPMRPSNAVTALRPDIEKLFGASFPWACIHLRTAATHLGFWAEQDGDKVHTGMEPINKTSLYYAEGREAIMRFAKQTPDAFVEVVGSKKTREAWKKCKKT
ncbi:MAG: ATP-binding protein [Rhodobacteraceae bacterium]|nr:ATP-binding protein [Paracoccaceae bacterium]